VAKLTLSFKGKLLKQIPVNPGRISIGRNPDCDLQIDSLAVSPVNAHIDFRDGIATIEAVDGSADIFVNHIKVNKQNLAENDLIRIGKHTLSFSTDNYVEEMRKQSEPEPEPEPASETATSIAGVGWLQILSGANVGKTIQLKSSLTDLGKLGIKPALIARRRDGYYISNLSDDVVLTVDNTNIGGNSQRLEDGANIRIDNVQLQFYLQNE
jgi:predicted component of type VI protein secretion system